MNTDVAGGCCAAIAVVRATAAAIRNPQSAIRNGRITQHYQAFRDQASALIAKHPQWFPQVHGHDLIGGIGGMMKFTPFGGKKDRIIVGCGVTYMF